MGKEAGLFPEVAIDSVDRATVAWSRSDGSNDRIQTRWINPG